MASDLREYIALIALLRSRDLSFAEIARVLEKDHGVHFSRQAVGNYWRRYIARAERRAREKELLATANELPSEVLKARVTPPVLPEPVHTTPQSPRVSVKRPGKLSTTNPQRGSPESDPWEFGADQLSK